MVRAQACAPARPAGGWRRGPALGWCMSQKTYRFVRDIPIADRQSVHGMPVMDVALRRIECEGYVKERRKKHEISRQEVYQRANILAFAVQAHAEPRGDGHGVTAAFRSKTRRLPALPRPWRTCAPHFLARRPQWPPIPSWFVHSVKGARSPPLRLALQTCPRRAHTRNDTGTMVGRCGWYFQP